MAATIDSATWTRPSARGKMDVVIGAKATASQPVAPKHDEGCGLSAYMALPTDQYVLIPLPNKAKLEKLDEGHFALRVPEIQIFNVWLRPYVVATVQVTEDGVIIEAQEAKIEGSPEVDRLELNSKTAFSIKVVLKGIEDPRGLRSKLVAQSEVNVWVDPPPIFRAMFPKRLMYETGNSVLRTTLNMLQNTFLQGLARDYERWATDKAYRETRKKLSA